LVLITARRGEIIKTTEQLLSYVDNGDYDNFLLVLLLVIFHPLLSAFVSLAMAYFFGYGYHSRLSLVPLRLPWKNFWRLLFAGARVLLARCPSYHPIYRVKVLNGTASVILQYFMCFLWTVRC